MGLLDLPGEIRNRIYRYATISEAVIEPHINRRIDTQGKIHDVLIDYLPALASVCTATRKELLPLYLAENHFCLVSEPEWDEGTTHLDFRRWETLVGDMAVHLAHVTLSDRRHDTYQFRREINVQVVMLKDGATQYNREKYLVLREVSQWCQELCCCDLDLIRTDLVYTGNDGRRIIDFLEPREWPEGFFDEDDCHSCGLTRVW